MELYDVLDVQGNKTGKIGERGKPSVQGEYFRIVHVWLINSVNEFLISKRASVKKTDPNIWEPTRGWVISGEDSIAAALREVKEELGLTLNPFNSRLIISRISSRDDAIVDVWLFREDIDIKNAILQPNEVSDIKWASGELIKKLVRENRFMAVNRSLTYIDDLFRICGI